MTAPNLTFIPVTSGLKTTTAVPLDQIPDDIKAQVEEVYEALKTNAGRMYVKFNTDQELNTYIAQVKSYCGLRPAGTIHFRKSPTRNQPKNEMHFRITDVPEQNAKDNAEINTAVDNVKAAAKAVKSAVKPAAK